MWYTTVLVFDEPGEYENIDFVDLSRTSGTHSSHGSGSLWVSTKSRRPAASLGFLDAEGNLNAKVTSAIVRGRALKLLYDPRKIMVDLVESEDTLAWFVKELLGQMCLRCADDPGDQLVAAAGSAEDIPGDQLVAAVGSADGSHSHQLVEKTLRSLRMQAGWSVCFDRKHNRFKVGNPPQYTPIKGWAKLAKQGTVSEMEAALAESSASVLEKCGPGEHAASGDDNKSPDAEQDPIRGCNALGYHGRLSRALMSLA